MARGGAREETGVPASESDQDVVCIWTTPKDELNVHLKHLALLNHVKCVIHFTYYFIMKAIGERYLD